MKKKFKIVLSYENDYEPNLSSEDVKEWISHMLNLKEWYGLKIVSAEEDDSHE